MLRLMPLPTLNPKPSGFKGTSFSVSWFWAAAALEARDLRMNPGLAVKLLNRPP